MLEQAGIAVSVHEPDIDDGRLRHGEVPPEWWVMSLAYLKARRVAEMLRARSSHLIAAGRGLVLGADTVCAVGRSVLGQPRDGADARRMLRLMHGREHRTLTGVCLLPLYRPDWRLIVFDAAIVRVGELSDLTIETYIASNEWHGKAGAYNLSERIAAGWPITCIGDPTTVMGLPMRRLPQWLERAAGAIDDC